MGVRAYAGPPYNVDDPDTPEKQHIEMNAAYLSSQSNGFESQQPLSVEFNYGYTNKLELTVSFGAISERTSGTARQSGMDDTGLEVRWRFLEETPSRPAIALGAQIKIPTASERLGLGTGRFDYTPEIIAGKSYGALSIIADAGISLLGARDQSSNAFWGFAGTYQTSPRLVLGAQVYGNGSSAGGEPSELAYGIGLEDTVKSGQTLMLQVGRSARGLSDLNIYAGIQFAWDTKRPELNSDQHDHAPQLQKDK